MGLSGSITNTIFLTFLHNQYAIGFFMGMVLSFLLLLLRPSRFAVLLLLGFLALLLGFEYNKHIIEPLQDQTLSSLNLGQENTPSKLLVLRTFQKLLPIGFFIIGWGSIFTAIFSKGLSKAKLPKE
ncbi:hypothetical protein A2982_03795 [candidate division WWE3 bacterium RIFCSPLOWO2_01_FULL_39_13]|uniref:Uncharacterized protein n=1 Tax=candidate division WWE3 bacterium RIFCSPLOWO2_01_FULL_39_13 TaxID=1802624 RepID=A0A1F4V3P6_UNCKA|nr:MAG: hypothetical protein A2982_03795 [candidate division WWE3 bacterium RIFCSPLOWO2_01_FULL_39_13]